MPLDDAADNAAPLLHLLYTAAAAPLCQTAVPRVPVMAQVYQLAIELSLSAASMMIQLEDT